MIRDVRWPAEALDQGEEPDASGDGSSFVTLDAAPSTGVIRTNIWGKPEKFVGLLVIREHSVCWSYRFRSSNRDDGPDRNPLSADLQFDPVGCAGLSLGPSRAMTQDRQSLQINCALRGMLVCAQNQICADTLLSCQQPNGLVGQPANCSHPSSHRNDDRDHPQADE